jgi:segregation and condensation protein A
LADFLVVATKLLLLKSQAILPAAEPEDEEASKLADQLRLYKLFADAAKHLDEKYGKTPLFAREKQAVIQRTQFVPPQGIGGEQLHQFFVQLLKRLEPFFALKEQSLERTVSVQERMEEIRTAILTRSKFAFSDMLSTARNKVDVVVSFLAMLELVKQRVIHVVQSEAFRDIMIKRVE